MGNCIIVQKSSSGSSYTAGNGIDITNDVVSNTAGMYTENIGTYGGSPAVVNADLLEGHDSSYFISKSGDTMTGNLTINGDSIDIKNPNIELGTVNNPSEYGYGVYMLDNNDKRIGYVQSLSTSDGRQGIQITAHTDITGSENYNSLSLAFNQSGERVLTVSDPVLWRNTLTAARKVVVVTSSSFSSLPQTISNSDITANHVVVNSVLSNPNAQTGDWTVTTSSGSLTISGLISGSTTITLYLIDQ